MANEVKSEFSVQEEFTRLGWRNDADSGALNFATITWKMNLFLWLKLFLRTKFFCFNFNFKWASYDVELVAKSKIQKTGKKKTCRVGVFSRSRRHVRTRSINVQILCTPFSLQFRWTMLIYRFRYCCFKGNKVCRISGYNQYARLWILRLIERTLSPFGFVNHYRDILWMNCLEIKVKFFTCLAIDSLQYIPDMI